jgi:nucleoside 2-deoxyribosyltransferase
VRIYLAARYSRRNEMRIHASELERLGFEVTSRWLEEDKPLTQNLGDDSPTFYQETAQNDLGDIDNSDTMIFFAEDPRVGTPRGGRHVEFGYAYATGKRMVVIGAPENIFHYLTDVCVYPTIREFIESEVPHVASHRRKRA